MNLESDNPTEGLSEFFETIWRDADGFVYLPTINRETNKWKKVFFAWPKHKDLIVQHVLASSAQGLDVYYAPALFKDHSAATKENFKGTYTLWTEFDGAAPEDWKPDPPILTADGSEAADGPPVDASGLPEPSLRVQSSLDGHEHVYWRLNEFVTDSQWVEDKNRAITYEHGADSSGWDCTQILRPPYTTNFKRDLPVTVRESTGSVFAQARFDFLKPPAQLVNESIDIANLPSVDFVVAKYTWDEKHFELFITDAPVDRSGALMKLGFFGAEKGMTDAEIYALLDHADTRWKKYVHRQDRKRRLTDIVNRARQKHPKALEKTTLAGLLGGSKQDKTPLGLPITYGFNDFLKSEIEVEWAVEGLVEVGGMGMFAAMPGVGKTQLGLQLAICCALGMDFLKWKMPKKQKIVFFSLEMSHVGLKFFIEQIAKEFTEEQRQALNENLILIPLGEVISLDRQEGMDFVYSLLDPIQPDGIIVDSIGKVTMKGLEEEMARLLNVQFKAIRDRYTSFMWFVHHNRKASENNKKPVSLGDVYGNQYLTADMTSILILWSDFKTDDEIEIIPVKMRLSKMEKAFLTHRNENLHFTLKASNTDKEMLESLNGNKDKEGSAKRPDDGVGHFGKFHSF